MHILALGILPFDRPERGRSTEQARHVVIGDHPPERTRIRCSHRFPLVEDCGAPGQQGCIDDVRMAHHPTHIRGRPIDVTRLDVEYVGQAPAKSDSMTTVIPNYPFGYGSSARGVQDVEGVGGLHRDTVGGVRGVCELIPVDIPTSHHGGRRLGSLVDYAPVGLMAGNLEGRVEQRLVLDHPVDFDAA